MSTPPNSTPWASIDNTSVVYSDACALRLSQFGVVAKLIQRWWRQRPLFPIPLGKKEVTALWFKQYCADLPKQDLQNYVYAYEKLDGTNLGIRCDGAIFGRRFQVPAGTKKYQNTSLEGTPPGPAVKRVKHGIADVIGKDPESMGSMVFYGELMCNPGIYGYTDRSMANAWIYFGLVFSPTTTDLPLGELIDALRRNGFFAYPDSKKVQVHLNPRLIDLVGTIDPSLRGAPLVSEGDIRSLCLEQRDSMMRCGMEGVVLSGSGVLHKWKTGKEDASKGGDKIGAVLSIPHEVLRVVGIDVEFAKCLHEVATQSNATPDKIGRAFESAMTKFDSLDAYFSSGSRKKIEKLLTREVMSDLGAFTSKEITCVRSEIQKAITMEYSAWEKCNKAPPPPPPKH